MPKCNFENHNIIHCVALLCSFSARCQEKHIASTLWALESHWREFIQRRGRSCNPNQLGIPSCRVREQAAELQPWPMGPATWTEIKESGSFSFQGSPVQGAHPSFAEDVHSNKQTNKNNKQTVQLIHLAQQYSRTFCCTLRDTTRLSGGRYVVQKLLLFVNALG